MAKSRFKIAKFNNPSRDVVWRLSGTLNGERIRRNFKTRKEAVAERQVLEIKHLNSQSDGQQVWTTLTHDQNRDAIAAANLLQQAGSNKTLSFSVNYLLTHYKESAETMTIEAAVVEYVEEKTLEYERGIISRRQERAIRIEMDKLQRFFATRMIGEIQAEELKDYLDTPLSRSKEAPSLKTWNNRRGYLSTFFKFCLQKKYVAENPILEIPQYKIKKARGTAETLSAKEAKRMMHWLESYRGKQNRDGSWWGKPGCMVPYFALTLFAGIRPDWKDGEIRKLRKKDIRFDTGVILIEPEVSKVNEKRTIKIQPNLRSWLKKYSIDVSSSSTTTKAKRSYPIIPRRHRDMMVDVRSQFKLPHDVLRHTFISMLVGSFRSVGDAALQSGNSESVIRKHYLNLQSEEESKRFWSILPKR
jgi:integrase